MCEGWDGVCAGPGALVQRVGWQLRALAHICEGVGSAHAGAGMHAHKGAVHGVCVQG